MRAPALVVLALAAAACHPAPEAEPAKATAPAASPPASPPAPALPPPSGARTWNFDADAEGSPPAGFTFARTGAGRPGRWVVREEKGAPSGGRVLVQEDGDATDFRFPVAVADAPEAGDVRVSVKCRMVSGASDQAAGLVFRYRDANGYYVVRANALEGNVNLYIVKGGARFMLTEWNGPADPGRWHDLQAEARGDAIVVRWDGKPIIDFHESTFPGPGRVGVWTKADSLTQFDDLVLETL